MKPAPRKFGDRPITCGTGDKHTHTHTDARTQRDTLAHNGAARLLTAPLHGGCHMQVAKHELAQLREYRPLLHWLSHADRCRAVLNPLRARGPQPTHATSGAAAGQLAA
eukprot:TRINITY_DN1319_c0_g2_i1.p2 TRINITY_DN1319_c0_g2~~TRINITY_DN1319_c0_g2_i1.p2  ORF type:complete len:109 (-),score=3.34 TRINITY_DN1319_c0_g2_i1:203-529(-)